MPNPHARTKAHDKSRTGALPGVLFLLLGLAVVLVLSWTAPAGAQDQAAGNPGAQPSSAQWATDCVDCPRYFNSMTDRSLQIDTAGRPHIAYGGDYLYYAWYDGATWHSERVDDSPYAGSDAALALDANGYAHISYADRLAGTLRYAYQDAAGWHIQTVDSDPLGATGADSSIKLDGDGHARISYSFSDNTTELSSLRYAWYDGALWHIETVDITGDVGYDTSLALDTDGYPHISYDDSDGWTIKYAHKDAGGWHLETVDPDTFDGRMSSLALDQSGQPHISYLNDDRLGYAYKDGSGWHLEIVDSRFQVSVGWYTSLSLDGQGHPYISYQEQNDPATAANLKVAYHDGATWQITTVDMGANPADSVGYFTSLDLGAGGYVGVSYRDATNGILRYSYYDGSVWHAGTAVDSGDFTGQYNSVALDAGGHARIAYYSGVLKDLKHAYQDAAGWHVETVDSAGDTGWYTSIAVDADGWSHISYLDFTNDDLKYAYQDASGWHVEVVDDTGGRFSSLVLDGDGYPHISYRGGVGIVRYAYQDASGWHREEVDTGLGFYAETSLALDAAGHPHIAYSDYTDEDLMYAQWTGSAWQIETVESSGRTGKYPSLALDANGYAHISFFAGNNANLRYARWTGSVWQKQNVDLGLGPIDVGDTALEVDGQGNVHVSYTDYNNLALKYARKDASGWQFETIAAHSGWHTSIAVDQNRNPHIAYYDYGTSDLRTVVSCTAVTGVSVDGPVALLVGEEGTYTATYSPVNATLPVDIAWDDGSVGATAVYSWTLPGSYEIAVSAENCGGTANTTFAVTVTEPPCEPLTGVSIGGPVTGETNTPYTFDAAIQPADATTPIAYTWSPEPDSGQGTASATYSWATEGSKTVTVSAENCGGTVTDNHTIAISEPPPPCEPLTAVTISGLEAGYTDVSYTFDAAIQPAGATPPIVYTWSPEPDSGQGTASAAYTWSTAGSKTVTVHAENCEGVVAVDSHTIVISEPPPVCPKPLTGVTVSGPTTGYAGETYTFTAAVQPADATPPIAYTWSPVPDSGQGTASVTYAWSGPGQETITVTAGNCGGTVSDTHTITLWGRLFLPLVIRQ